jgi:predicted Zn-dependent protease
MTIIILVPIAIDEEDKKSIFSPLANQLASIFDASITIITDPPPLDSSSVSFNKQRNQLNSDKLLRWLATTMMNNTESYDPRKIILGICNFDAYSSETYLLPSDIERTSSLPSIGLLILLLY